MIGLREDQQMKALIIDYLNHAIVHCGSGLAREGGGSVDESVTDRPHSRASPLPHWTAVGFRSGVGSLASKPAG